MRDALGFTHQRGDAVRVIIETVFCGPVRLLPAGVIPAHDAVFGDRFLLVAESDEPGRDLQTVIIAEQLAEMAALEFVLVRAIGIGLDSTEAFDSNSLEVIGQKPALHPMPRRVQSVSCRTLAISNNSRLRAKSQGGCAP